MKYFFGFVLAGVGLNGVAPAHADGNLSASVGATRVAYEIDDSDEYASLSALALRIGYDINDMFSFESEGGLGVGEDEVVLDATIYRAEIEYLAGSYARVNIPIRRNIELFARVGYNFLSLKEESEFRYYPGSSNLEQSDTYSGLAGGIGAQIDLNERHGLRADLGVMDFGESDGYDNGGLATVSVAYTFTY